MAPSSRSFSLGSMGLRLGAATLVFVASAALPIGCKDAAPTPSPDQAQTRPEAVNAEPKAVAQEGAPTAAEAPKAAPAENKPEGESAAPQAAAPGAQAPAADPKIASKTTPQAANTPSPTTTVSAPVPAPTDTTPPPPTASAAPEPPPPPPVVSPKVAEATFSLWMQSSGRYKAGQQGFVEVVLVPKGEFHCNQEYPYKVKMGAPPAGVTYPTAIVRSEGLSVSPQRATMRVPFIAQNAGDAKVSGQFFFSVCTSDQCVLDNRTVAVTVKVE